MSVNDFPEYDFRGGIIACAIFAAGFFVAGLGVGWLIWG